jgi:hypothetical protein
VHHDRIGKSDLPAHKLVGKSGAAGNFANWADEMPGATSQNSIPNASTSVASVVHR